MVKNSLFWIEHFHPNIEIRFFSLKFVFELFACFDVEFRISSLYYSTKKPLVRVSHETVLYSLIYLPVELALI